MHVCIIGTGAAGWIACNYIKNLDVVEKVTIIGSSKIPSIGVGESNTMAFNVFLQDLIDRNEFSMSDFLEGTDAAIKYGVMYKGWSKNDFIHHFKSWTNFYPYENHSNPLKFYGRSLANKEKDVHIHDFLAPELFKEVRENNVLLDQDENRASFHFDAAKFINFFSSIATKNKKVSLVEGTVLWGEKIDDRVNKIFLDNERTIEADFFIFATGDYQINENFLEIKYKDMGEILLTNKAVVYPLKYTNKRDEFHPYTVAKTMKYGWRWITPTWSRVGTGYVFSDNHISQKKAIEEFILDIGDKTIEPMIVSFNPKHNSLSLHDNWCTLGMASGFLEPLDAPGLSMTVSSLINQVSYYINFISKNPKKEFIELEKERLNEIINNEFYFWAAFILSQYKTSSREDSDFWKDHKKIEWDFYSEILNNIDSLNSPNDYFMIHQTMAAKDINWNTSIRSKPYRTRNFNYRAMHHLDYIQYIKDKKI